MAASKELKPCKTHGDTLHYQMKNQPNSWKCQKCNTERVTEMRRKNKRKLVEFFGGKCTKCGYDRYVGALEFHHLDPNSKEFGMGAGGISWSFKRMVEEAKKCILVCSNCHREIHSMDP
jgi:5-methylcytosine-specific restriction endonuclease McrA